MSFFDLVLIASLLGFAVLWWLKSVPNRTRILYGLALLAIILGIYGVMIYRWQAGIGGGVGAIFLLATFWDSRRSEEKRAKRPFITGPIFALLAVAGFIPLHWFPLHDLPAPSGEFAVGVRDFELVDESRKGVNGVGENDPRRLLVRVWYPAGNVSGMEVRPYYNEAETDTAARALGDQIGAGFLGQSQSLIDTNSYENAPLLDGAEQLPTIIYSHGYGAHLAQNTALMEELASNGYVIYSVHHTGDAGAIYTPSGELLELDPAIIEMRETMQDPDSEETQKITEQFIAMLAGESYDDRLAGVNKYRDDSVAAGERTFVISPEVWTSDRIFVHDQLEAGAVPENVAEIVAASRFDRTGQIGMSYGGSTTGRVCQIDLRCAAGINLDGGDFHYDPFNANMRVPFMMMYSDSGLMMRMLGASEEEIERANEINDYSYERHELAGLSEDIHRVIFLNSAHGTYSDMKWHIRSPLLSTFLGDVDPSDALSVQNDFVRGFFDRYLKGEDSGFPSAQFAQYEGVTKPSNVDPLREWWVNANPEDRTQSLLIETEAGNLHLAFYGKNLPDAVALEGVQLTELAATGSGKATERPLKIVGLERGLVVRRAGSNSRAFSIELAPRSEAQLAEDGYEVVGRVVSGLTVLEAASSAQSDVAISRALPIN